MELLLVVALLGVAYCGYSDSLPMGRLFEIIAVIITLALIYFVQQTAQPLSVSLPIAMLLVSPLWLACFYERTKLADRNQQTDASASQLWQEWDSAKNAHREPLRAATQSLVMPMQNDQLSAQSGIRRLDPIFSQVTSLSLQERVAANIADELTESDLELAPMEDWRHKRRL